MPQASTQVTLGAHRAHGGCRPHGAESRRLGEVVKGLVSCAQKPVTEALLVIYRKWARVARMGSINARAPVLPPAHYGRSCRYDGMN